MTSGVVSGPQGVDRPIAGDGWMTGPRGASGLCRSRLKAISIPPGRTPARATSDPQSADYSYGLRYVRLPRDQRLTSFAQAIQSGRRVPETRVQRRLTPPWCQRGGRGRDSWLKPHGSKFNPIISHDRCWSAVILYGLPGAGSGHLQSWCPRSEMGLISFPGSRPMLVLAPGIC
jgi:hypothetical protein